MAYSIQHYNDTVSAYYRAGTTDENVLKEVVEKKAYRKISIGFDVENGESWLDLGANIGAFAVYCRLKEAHAVCYEPENQCFTLLRKNAIGFQCHRSCISGVKEHELTLWTSSTKGNNSRGTLYSSGRSTVPTIVPNTYGGLLRGQWFDGVKMDIEGSEGDLIDEWLLPACNKLCLEYHTSRDDSMVNLARRLTILKSRFDVVSYPPELDRMVAAGGRQRATYDRLIFCIGAKKKPR